MGLQEKFRIVFHAFRLLWVMLMDVMTSSHLFSYIIVVHKCVTSIYGTVVKRVDCIRFVLFIHLLDSSDRPGI